MNWIFQWFNIPAFSIRGSHLCNCTALAVQRFSFGEITSEPSSGRVAKWLGACKQPDRQCSVYCWRGNQSRSRGSFADSQRTQTFKLQRSKHPITCKPFRKYYVEREREKKSRSRSDRKRKTRNDCTSLTRLAGWLEVWHSQFNSFEFIFIVLLRIRNGSAFNSFCTHNEINIFIIQYFVHSIEANERHQQIRRFFIEYGFDLSQSHSTGSEYTSFYNWIKQRDWFTQIIFLVLFDHTEAW